MSEASAFAILGGKVPDRQINFLILEDLRRFEAHKSFIKLIYVLVWSYRTIFVEKRLLIIIIMQTSWHLFFVV